MVSGLSPSGSGGNVASKTPGYRNSMGVVQNDSFSIVVNNQLGLKSNSPVLNRNSNRNSDISESINDSDSSSNELIQIPVRDHMPFEITNQMPKREPYNTNVNSPSS